jgi:hypothetical protein
VQRWPETKRLLGLLVNSAGGAHARNARRLIHAARKQDRRLAAALLAAALAHTPEAEEALRGARTRMARKPPALARELLRNFPKRRARNARRRRKGGANGAGPDGALTPGEDGEVTPTPAGGQAPNDVAQALSRTANAPPPGAAATDGAAGAKVRAADGNADPASKGERAQDAVDALDQAAE